MRRTALALRVAAPLLLALPLLTLPALARADVWAYIDERGIAHFASEPLDARYQLFARGPALDASLGLGPTLQRPGDPPSESLTEVSGAAPAPAVAPARSPLVAYVENSPTYRQVQPQMREAARAHNLDYELIKAVIAAESGFDAQAVSPKGAIGLMQVIPATAERFGVREDTLQAIERRLADPATNIRTGSRYLRHLLNLFEGRLELALAAYNAGEGAVQRAGNRIPNIRETQHYVRTVLQIYGLLKPAPPAPARVQMAAPSPPPRPARTELPGLVPGRANMPAPLKTPTD